MESVQLFYFGSRGDHSPLQSMPEGGYPLKTATLSNILQKEKPKNHKPECVQCVELLTVEHEDKRASKTPVEAPFLPGENGKTDAT